MDIAVTDKEGVSLGKGSLTFRRSRANTTIAFDDTRLKLYGTAPSDSTLWDGWSYNVLASDGKTSLVSGKTDIVPDILDGTIRAGVSLDSSADLVLDVRARADRDQDIADVELTICESDCVESTVLDAEITTVYRAGVAAKGAGDPLDNSWTITSTGRNAEGKVVAGPYKVTVTGVERGARGGRTIRGGSLRKDGISWRLRPGKRTDWLEWDNSEMIHRTQVPAHSWTHVVVANGKSSLSLGKEQWQDQRLRGEFSTAGDAAAKELLEIVSASDFGGTLSIGITLFDSAGKAVSKGTPTKERVIKSPSDGRWNTDKAYSWP